MRKKIANYTIHKGFTDETILFRNGLISFQLLQRGKIALKSKQMNVQRPEQLVLNIGGSTVFAAFLSLTTDPHVCWNVHTENTPLGILEGENANVACERERSDSAHSPAGPAA